MSLLRLFLRSLSIAALLPASHLCLGQPPQISYAAVTTAAPLSAPVDVVNAGDGSNRLFIVEQGGAIKVWNGTTTRLFAHFGAAPGANIINFGGEEGLLSMAFHPSYDGVSNRYFFIYYTDRSGDISIARYETKAGNADTVDPITAVPVITVPHPGQSNHNGGKLNFGSDGFLYFATGDGGGGNDPDNSAQDGASLLGKMIRIDINTTSATYGNYAVPPGNPYLLDNTVDDRIWALGLRNPFRWSFDRATGDMWIGDVGQGEKEEINFRPATGAGRVNYGWRCYEGYIPTPGVQTPCVPADYVPPVYDYDNPSSGNSAVTGGYVYRGSEFPAFRGYYIAADVYSGDVHLLYPNSSGGFDSSVQPGLTRFIVGFGEAEDGTLYAVSQGTNTLYKVVAVGGTALPAILARFSVRALPGYNELSWQTLSEQGTSRFWVEYSSTSSGFVRVGEVAAVRRPEGSSYAFRHNVTAPGIAFYRLRIEDNDGTFRYSPVVRVGIAPGKVRVYPTIVNNGLLTIEAPGGLEGVEVMSADGNVVLRQKRYEAPGVATVLRLPQLAPGVYYVVLLTGDGTVRERIVVQ